MKPAEHKISDASFTGHYLKILIAKLKQFKSTKHVVLISMVLLCILARYMVLSMDKNQTKSPGITEKFPKTRSRTPKLLPNGT